MLYKLLITALVSGATMVGKCQAQAVPVACELLVISSHQQVIELHKPEYTLTATKVGWNLKILNPEALVKISELENPEISFCIGNKEVLAQGNDMLASAASTGATACYPTRHQKVYRLANGAIPITLLELGTRK